MKLIPRHPFFDYFEDMDKLFGDMHPMKMEFSPSADVYEEKGNVVVEMNLAGIDPEKVDISVQDNILTVKGESEKKNEVEDKNYYRKEISKGSFHRSIALPAKVIGEKASASAKDGILKVVIPKSGAKEEKSIKVKVEKEKSSKPKLSKKKK